MLYAPPVDRSPALHHVARFAASTRDERVPLGQRFDVTRLPIPTYLEVGDTTYQLRSRLVGTFIPGRAGVDGEFVVPDFFPDFVGSGRAVEEAFVDWRDRVHARFQELYSMRPFEMTEQEKADWRFLESQFDVAAYRLGTPLTIRQIGKVIRSRPLPDLIEWEDGQKESVRPDQVPGEFVTYKPGQPFEAFVSRDPVDFHLLRFTHVQRIRLQPELSPEEVEDIIRLIPTSSSLPDANWD